MPAASGTAIIVVSGVAARAVLWPDFAPISVAALAALARTATEGRATLRLTVAEAG